MTDSNRSIARITGVLFIIATVTVLASTAFLGSASSKDYLTKMADNQGQVEAGVLLLSSVRSRPRR